MNEQPDKLDQLLAAWSQHHEPSVSRLKDLQAKIFHEVAARDRVVTPAMPTGRMYGPALYITALVACSVLVAVIGYWNISREQEAIASLPPPAARLPQDHLERLLSEMDRLFEDRIAWVAETNQEVSLALNEASLRSHGPRVAVRVVVLKRTVGETSWRPIWTGDIASRSEELVQLSPADGTSGFRLWTHVLADGTVAVDTELGVEGSGPVWSSSSVQQPLIPQQVLSSRTQQSEFQVWQTAAILPEGAL